MHSIADEFTGTAAVHKNSKVDELETESFTGAVNISKQQQFGRSSKKMDFEDPLSLEDYLTLKLS